MDALCHLLRQMVHGVLYDAAFGVGSDCVVSLNFLSDILFDIQVALYNAIKNNIQGWVKVGP